MEISTFKVKVQKAVSEVLGQEYTVELREVQKNNGVLLQGLMIRKGQDNVTPTIYLNSFWEAYEGGVTFADIIKKIISIYKEDGIGRKIDVSFFQDFEKVKEKLCDHSHGGCAGRHTAGTSGGSPEGIFEEGIHDDPDEFPQDLRCLQHPVSRDAGAAGRAYRRRLLHDHQFCS